MVDIGGGTTEVAAVAGGGWSGPWLRKAGNAMDDAIVQAARNKLGLIISQRAARHLKTTLGVTGGADGFAEVVGLDVAQRTPRSEYVYGGLVADALEPIVAAIAATVHEMLSEIPAGLAEDVVRGKVRLAGGGALLPGLAARIETAAASARSWSRIRCGACSAVRPRSSSARTKASSPDPACVSRPGPVPLGKGLFIPNGAVLALLQRLPGDGGRLPAGHQPADDRRDHRHADQDEQQLRGGHVGQFRQAARELAQA